MTIKCSQTTPLTTHAVSLFYRPGLTRLILQEAFDFESLVATIFKWPITKISKRISELPDLGDQMLNGNRGEKKITNFMKEPNRKKVHLQLNGNKPKHWLAS